MIWTGNLLKVNSFPNEKRFKGLKIKEIYFSENTNFAPKIILNECNCYLFCCCKILYAMTFLLNFYHNLHCLLSTFRSSLLNWRKFEFELSNMNGQRAAQTYETGEAFNPNRISLKAYFVRHTNFTAIT